MTSVHVCCVQYSPDYLSLVQALGSIEYFEKSFRFFFDRLVQKSNGCNEAVDERLLRVANSSSRHQLKT